LAVTLHRSLLRGRSIRIRRRLAQLRHAIGAVSRSPWRLVLGWLLGTSVQGTYVMLTALLGITCGLRLPLRVWLFAWPLAKIAAVMPITKAELEFARRRSSCFWRPSAHRRRRFLRRELFGRA